MRQLSLMLTERAARVNHRPRKLFGIRFLRGGPPFSFLSGFQVFGIRNRSIAARVRDAIRNRSIAARVRAARLAWFGVNAALLHAQHGIIHSVQLADAPFLATADACEVGLRVGKYHGAQIAVKVLTQHFAQRIEVGHPVRVELIDAPFNATGVHAGVP